MSAIAHNTQPRLGTAPANLGRIVFAAAVLVSVVLLLPIHASAATIGKPGNYLTLNTGLVGWWTMDGQELRTNVADRSGQGNHGSLIGQTSTTTVSGKIGQALSFDGVNDYIAQQNNVANLRVAEGSVCSWVKTTLDNGQALISLHNGSSASVFDITIGNNVTAFLTDEMISIDINDNGGSNVARIGYTTANRSELFDGGWHHICVTGDTAYGIYIDGVSKTVTVGNGTDDGRFTDDTDYTNAEIGSFASTAYFRGALDDMRIYNRALTAAEVRALYTAGGAKISRGASAGGALSQGLIGYWPFEGSDMYTNVADRSGNGNDGFLRLLTTGNTATTTDRGKVGQALILDGVNDSVYREDGASAMGAQYFTIAAWFRKDTPGVNVSTGTAGTNGEPLVTKLIGEADNSNVDGNYFLGLNSATMKLVGDFENNTSGYNSPVVGGTTLASSTWYFAAFTFDGTAERLYLNGVLDGTTATTALPRFDSIQDFGIGAAYNSSGTRSGAFGGAIDEVRVYSRALSATEIVQLYELGKEKISQSNPGVPGQGLSQGLVGHWTFDGPDIRTNIADRSGQGNHGYLIGQTSTTTAGGRLGQAIQLFEDDYVNIDAGGTQYVNSAAPHTVSAWIYHKGRISLNHFPHIVVLRSDTTNPWQLFLSITSNYIGINFGAAADWVRMKSDQTQSALVDDWHHVAVTYNGSGASTGSNFTLYFDGAERAISAATGGYTSLTQRSYIGETVTSLNEGWDGHIDDVRIYNRALSAAEVLQLYNQGR